MTTLLPEWLARQHGTQCADCHTATAVTFWRSLGGPPLCWLCCEKRLADLP